MDDNQKFSVLIGGIFFSVGVLLLIISLGLLIAGGFFGLLFPAAICFLIGIVFAAIGGGFLLSAIKASKRRNDIAKKGTKYSGKIYGYVEDKSFTMNGDFLVNTKVHFFDANGIEREAIIDTRFTKGTAEYPVGATIDIVEYNGKYTWVPGSVRYTHLDREEELLDDKPVAPDKLRMVAISCQSCGASYTAAAGYAAKCPYCGAAVNVKQMN